MPNHNKNQQNPAKKRPNNNKNQQNPAKKRPNNNKNQQNSAKKRPNNNKNQQNPAKTCQTTTKTGKNLQKTCQTTTNAYNINSQSLFPKPQHAVASSEKTWELSGTAFASEPVKFTWRRGQKLQEKTPENPAIFRVI